MGPQSDSENTTIYCHQQNKSASISISNKIEIKTYYFI